MAACRASHIMSFHPPPPPPFLRALCIMHRPGVAGKDVNPFLSLLSLCVCFSIYLSEPFTSTLKVSYITVVFQSA